MTQSVFEKYYQTEQPKNNVDVFAKYYTGEKEPDVQPPKETQAPIKQEVVEQEDGSDIKKASETISPFMTEHPNIYGAVGAATEITKAIPFAKYLYEDEREKYSKLDPEHQALDLVKEFVFASAGAAISPATKGVASVFAKNFPKTAKSISGVLNKEITVAGSKQPKKVATIIKDKIDDGAKPDEIMTMLDDAAPKEKYAGSINLEKQNISNEAKNIELEAAKNVPKTVQTWDETGKLSSEIANDYKKGAALLTKMKAGGVPNTVEMDAARQINANAVNKLKEMAETLSPEDFAAQFVKYREDVFRVVSNASSEAGRLLNIHKKVVSPNRIATAFAKLENGLNKRQLEEFRNINFENPIEVEDFISRLKDPTVKDYFFEFWYNSILSGPPTHLVNAISNTTWGIFQLPTRALSGGIDAMYSMLKPGRPRTRYVQEIIPMAAGYPRAVKRGLASAWDVVRGKKLKSFDTKWSREIGSAAGAFERSPNEFVRGVGKFITIPSRGLRAMDVLGNAAAYDTQMAALAKRTGLQQGLSGKALLKFEKEFVRDAPEWAHKDAFEFAKYSTFMDEPSQVAQGIMKVRDGLPFGSGRFIIPFVRTIDRLLVRGLEMTPGVGLATAKAQGKSMVEPDVVAKQIEGLIISAAMWNKFDSGEITGEAPRSEAERERFYAQGKRPWAVHMGGSVDEKTGEIKGGVWIEYRRFEPFNTIVASAYAAYENILNAPDEKTATEKMINAADTMKNNLVDSSYFEGLSMITDRYNKARGAGKRIVTSLVPYSGFLRSIVRAWEAEEEGSAKVRDTSTLIGAFGSTIPGLHKLAEPKIDVWGNEIELEGGMFRQWLPYKWSSQKDDLVENNLAVLDVYPGKPENKYSYNGKTKNFTEDEYRNFAILYGHKAYGELEKMFQNSAFQEAMLDEKNHERLRNKIDSLLTKIRESERKRAIMMVEGGKK